MDTLIEKLNIPDFLQEIFSLKNLLGKKDEEIEMLHKALLHQKKRNQSLEAFNSTLLNELSQLNNAASSIWSALSAFENFEEDKKILNEERNKLKLTLENQEKLHQKELKDVKAEIECIKASHQEEMTIFMKKAKHEESEKLEPLIQKLKEKENEFTTLGEHMKKALQEKDQEILKMKVENEEKMEKLKLKSEKMKTAYTPNGFKKDVFRQKYMKLEKEHLMETTKLKDQIKKLQAKIVSLGDNSSSLSILLENSTAQNKNPGNQESNVNQSQSDALLSRRLKANPQVQNFNYAPFNKKQTNISYTKNEAVCLHKRKLFNPNTNYFDK